MREQVEKDGTAPSTTIDCYKVGKVLGKGAFGQVNIGLQIITRKLVAMKRLDMSERADDRSKEKVLLEVKMLQRMRHQNVINLYETIEEPKALIYVLELCPGGDLLNYVRKRRKLKPQVAKKLMK